jgi:hypothetical protein
MSLYFGPLRFPNDFCTERLGISPIHQDLHHRLKVVKMDGAARSSTIS